MSDWGAQLPQVSGDGAATGGKENAGKSVDAPATGGLDSGGYYMKTDPRSHGWAVPKAVDYPSILAPINDSTDWASNKKKYEPKLKVADDGSYAVDKEIEAVLYDPALRMAFGEHIETYQSGKIKICHTVKPKNDAQLLSFQDERIHPEVRANLERSGYTFPLPIQYAAAPYVLEGFDVLAVAQTGSGKTAAYLIPILTKMLANNGKMLKEKPHPLTFDPKVEKYVSEPVALIVVPTRELAIQIGDEVARLSYKTGIRYGTVYGGAPKRQQLSDIQRGCDILIATPGRLKDVVQNHNNVVSLNRCRFTVLDEADELVTDDWVEELGAILRYTDDNGQYFLFSATFTMASREMAREYLGEKRMMMCIERFGVTHRNIHQVIVDTDPSKKRQALLDLLLSLPATRTMIFCNTQRGVDDLDDFLYNRDFPCTAVHSGRTQREREDSIASFRSGEVPILIATGVTSRGLDLPNVKHVVNYDLPSVDHGGITEYVHRIGRTGRMGHLGQATSFFTSRDEPLGEQLAALLTENAHALPPCLEQYATDNPKEVFEQDNLDAEVNFEIGGPTEGGRVDGGANGGGDGWGAGGADGSGADAGATAGADNWGNGGGAGADLKDVDGW